MKIQDRDVRCNAVWTGVPRQGWMEVKYRELQCELPTNHDGTHRSGDTYWLEHAPEPQLRD